MALSASTFSSAGGAVSDLFSGFAASTNADLQAKGLRIKAQGDLAEGQEYDLAGQLAGQNAQYTETSTAIQQAQQDRNTTMQIGGQRADIAGAGFGESGSALDILRDSASQGALAKATLGQQGLITEAGYQEQEQSYNLMASTARTAAASEDQLASDTEAAGQKAEKGDFLSGAIKGVAAIASIALAPATGGASLAIGGLLMGGGTPSGY